MTPGSGTYRWQVGPAEQLVPHPHSPASRPDTKGSFRAPQLPALAGLPTGLKRTQSSSSHLFPHPDSRLRAWPRGSSALGSGHFLIAQWLGEWGMEVCCPGCQPSSSPQSRPAPRRRRRRRNAEWGQGSGSTDGEWEALPSIWGRVGGRSLGRTRGRGQGLRRQSPERGRALEWGWACEPVLEGRK